MIIMGFETGITLFKYLVFIPLVGMALTRNIFVFLGLLGLEYDKKTKLKGIIPITVIIYIIIALLIGFEVVSVWIFLKSGGKVPRNNCLSSYFQKYCAMLLLIIFITTSITPAYSHEIPPISSAIKKSI